VRFKKRILAASFAAFATLGMVIGSAFAADYDQTGFLDHGGNGICIGYGWGDSDSMVGVSSGTVWYDGDGPCYRKQDAYYEYNTVDVFNPPNTGWQTYDLSQGAGPQGTCDLADTDHWVSQNGSGSATGSTWADDGC
jgi:hypothetical protein